MTGRLVIIPLAPLVVPWLSRGCPLAAVGRGWPCLSLGAGRTEKGKGKEKRREPLLASGCWHSPQPPQSPGSPSITDCVQIVIPYPDTVQPRYEDATVALLDPWSAVCSCDCKGCSEASDGLESGEKSESNPNPNVLPALMCGIVSVSVRTSES